VGIEQKETKGTKRMTQEQFNAMALLLRAGEAMEVLGVEREQLRELRRSDPELAVRLPGGKEWRYRKEKVAQMARLRFE
jgi:hypothetical protein